MAEKANQEGNKLYKDGQFGKAQKCFLKASKLDKAEPKYPSNLSAVLYELGQYVDCILAIQLSWGRLAAQNEITPRDGESDPLAIKLATRFAKAKINGVASGVISLHKKKKSVNEKIVQFEVEIDAFAAGFNEETDNKIKELQAAWRQWRSVRDECAQHSAETCKDGLSAAASRLRGIPIYKCATDPTLEYFRFGHDPVQSMMDGINGSPDDEYCLDMPWNKDEENWTFVFGGSGDARHVFATLIHLSDIGNELGDGSQVDRISVHMTLIDIHPATLARVVLIFGVLREILETRISNNKVKRTELHATLFYLYTTMVMPEYCCQILMRIAGKLAQEIPKGTFTLSKCLHINAKSMVEILDHLMYWSKPLDKSTQVFLEKNPPPAMSNMEAMGLGNLAFSPGLDMSMLKQRPQAQKTQMEGPAGSLNLYTNPDAEPILFKRTRALLPPKTLLSRHPALEKVVKAFPKPSEAQYAAAIEEVMNTWHPNPTLFDLVYTENSDYGQENGYPKISNNPFETTTSFAEYNKEFESGGYKSSSGSSSFVACSRFFEMVADAVWELQNTLKVEMVVGDAITTLPKLFAGELGQRPKTFPREYSRIFLSNVPDYTHGALNTAVHLVQYVETGAIVMANCLLNTGNFRNIEEYCYNYTLLRAADFPRFLGCEVVGPHRIAFDDIALKKLQLPRQLDQLATKQELHTWLAQLLLCTICNGKPRMPPSRVDLPNNTNAFLHVLVHLHRVGFPAHWIGDFVQSMLSNNLVTVVQPYIGLTPVPMSESNNRKPSRKVNLEPWQAEFEVIFASTLLALPFAVSLPPDYPVYSDIRTFQAETKRINLTRHPKAHTWKVLLSGYTKAIGLMFYKPTSAGADIEDLANSIPSMIEGKSKHRGLQILLAQENCDLRKGEVSWRMSRQRYEQMKSDGWFMSTYRTDLNAAATLPVSADFWMEVSV